MHELCRFAKTKPANQRGILNAPEKTMYSISIDGLCRFAGLQTLEVSQNYEKFHSVEQNSNNVENLWKSPHENER